LFLTFILKIRSGFERWSWNCCMYVAQILSKLCFCWLLFFLKYKKTFSQASIRHDFMYQKGFSGFLLTVPPRKGQHCDRFSQSQWTVIDIRYWFNFKANNMPYRFKIPVSWNMFSACRTYAEVNFPFKLMILIIIYVRTSGEYLLRYDSEIHSVQQYRVYKLRCLGRTLKVKKKHEALDCKIWLAKSGHPPAQPN